MRKVTDKISRAFLAGRSAKVGNTRTDGRAIYLHGNKIAEWVEEPGHGHVFRISLAGWPTPTTRERLNGLLQHATRPLPGRGHPQFFQKDFETYVHDKHGEWKVNPDAWLFLVSEQDPNESWS